MLAAKLGDPLNTSAVIDSTPQSVVTFNGVPLAVVGAGVSDHGGGAHDNAQFAVGSAVFSINGLPVVLTGNPATCGHVAVGTTAIDVTA